MSRKSPSLSTVHRAKMTATTGGLEKLPHNTLFTPQRKNPAMPKTHSYGLQSCYAIHCTINARAICYAINEKAASTMQAILIQCSMQSNPKQSAEQSMKQQSVAQYSSNYSDVQAMPRSRQSCQAIPLIELSCTIDGKGVQCAIYGLSSDV